MNKEAIFECLMSIKIKNTEGFDRIRQRILVDGCVNLIDPLTELFGLVNAIKNTHEEGTKC